MNVKVGSKVKLTDEFVNSCQLTWVQPLKNVEITILRIRLESMHPVTTYKVYFKTAGGMLHNLPINKTGHYVDGNSIGDLVFDPIGKDEEGEEEKSGPGSACQGAPAWVPNSTPPQRKPLTGSECNCKCPHCGAPALDMAFMVECTNPGCPNYPNYRR